MPRLSKPVACPKPSSRLQDKQAAKKLTVVTERDFLKEVQTRDKMLCRCCGRKTRITLEHVPEQCQVHHLHGRLGDLRCEARCALVLCLECHEPVTGAVNHKVIVVGTKFIKVAGQPCIDARAPVRFERVA